MFIISTYFHIINKSKKCIWDTCISFHFDITMFNYIQKSFEKGDAFKIESMFEYPLYSFIYYM